MAARFRESAFTPLTLRDNVYALPESQGFFMMFCRDDILYEVGLEVPETWEELAYAMMVLARRNMTVGMPSGVSGMSIFLYQAGGSLYNEDGTASNLKSAECLEAFKTITSMFNEYSLPVQFDFANRFRSGEMPIGIVDYTMYNQLELYAPDIKGLWSMYPVPGTEREDGSVDHTSVASVTGTFIMKQSEKQDVSWEFLKWWSSAETQSRFASSMESILGPSAKQPIANIEAFEQMSWTADELTSLREQGEALQATPIYPGSYMLVRNLEFAFTKAVTEKSDPVNTLLDYVEDVDDEIAWKNQEFGFIE